MPCFRRPDHNYSKDKANALNNHFSIHLSMLPTISDTTNFITNMSTLTISHSPGYKIYFQKLKQKATYFTQHCANLQFYKYFLCLPAHYRLTGYQKTSVQYSKRVTVTMPVIIDRYP